MFGGCGCDWPFAARFTCPAIHASGAPKALKICGPAGCGGGGALAL
jgi:hypothetical protein